MVTFRSGRQLYLSGTNDVDEDNRGVIVKIPEIGKIKIGWDDFESVEFKAPPVSSGPAYDSYGSSKKIQGTVQTIKGIKFSGRIVYDLDEEWDYELLHGNDDEIEYAKKNSFPEQHFAARFAAKEAVFKAFGGRIPMGWKDIKILNDERGKPVCILKNNDSNEDIFISISHTKNYAVATAIITKKQESS